VKCDAETNPPEARDLGQLVVEIGIAPVKPAEFVIFRIGQMQPGS
jgi:phage tail sheath protein FI